MMQRTDFLLALTFVMIGCGAASNNGDAASQDGRGRDLAALDMLSNPDARDAHLLEAGNLDFGPDANRTAYTSWRACGWSDPTCLCQGFLGCNAIAGGTFESLGSAQSRVCGIEGDVCDFVIFIETEGGGVARRCRVPLSELSCNQGVVTVRDDQCAALFACNLQLGDCPPDVTPGGTVISCQ
jgi:hypothetical protein